MEQSKIIDTLETYQHLPASPLGDVINSLKSPCLVGDSQPNYIRLEFEADDGELRFPPTTHYIATVKDLTDMLDYDSEDINGMDDCRRRSRTSAYRALESHLVI